MTTLLPGSETASRQPHKLETAGSTPAPATTRTRSFTRAEYLPPVTSPYLTEIEAAAFFRGAITAKTLKNWRVKGRGPRYTKLGDSVLYRIEWLEEFADARARISTSDKTANGQPDQESNTNTT